ncbi:MAG TPA: hypothetical protein VHW74_09050 [Mycobacteriales bacterium]|nr:hypothetical protein [Mycobacteriales bacterium]
MTFLRRQWDRVAAGVLLLVGVLSLVLGWIGVSGTTHVAAQLPYFISGGLFGLFLLGVGHMLWTSADLRDEWAELRAIRRLLEDQAADGPQNLPAGEPVAAAPEILTNGVTRHPAARRKATAGSAARSGRPKAAP